jgi:hypothetical protein
MTIQLGRIEQQQLTLALEDGIRLGEACAAKAGPDFYERAKRGIVDFLSRHGEASGEDITDALKRQGIIPHDDRAFGPAYFALARTGVIQCVRVGLRRKGHGTAGLRVWRLA